MSPGGEMWGGLRSGWEGGHLSGFVLSVGFLVDLPWRCLLGLTGIFFYYIKKILIIVDIQ